MRLYRNKIFRIILGIVLCFFFIKIALYIGRTYWGTIMFLSGAYLFFYTFFSIIDNGIEKAVNFHEKYNKENINRQPLSFL
jgi:cell shape-determining protein MreC